MHQPDLGIRWQQILYSWTLPVFWVVVVMLFFNWGLEAMKWKLLLHSLESISFLKAFQSVMAGCSITMLTPNRTGEFGGRVLFLKTENRVKGISLTILGSISQLIITCLLGLLGLIYLRITSASLLQTTNLHWVIGNIFIFFNFAMSLGLLLLFFKVRKLGALLARIKWIEKRIHFLDVLNDFSNKDLLRLLFYSLLRYLIFILQFLWMLQLMQVHLNVLIGFWLVAVFYQIMALVPTIGFTELPVRATAGVFIFGIFSTNTLGIQATTFAIWVINLVIPALLGGYFLMRVRIIK